MAVRRVKHNANRRDAKHHESDKMSRIQIAANTHDARAPEGGWRYMGGFYGAFWDAQRKGVDIFGGKFA